MQIPASAVAVGDTIEVGRVFSVTGATTTDVEVSIRVSGQDAPIVFLADECVELQDPRRPCQIIDSPTEAQRYEAGDVLTADDGSWFTRVVPYPDHYPPKRWVVRGTQRADTATS